MPHVTFYVSEKNLPFINTIKEDHCLSESIIESLKICFHDDIRLKAINIVKLETKTLIEDLHDIIILDQYQGKTVINDLINDFCNDLYQAIDKV